MRKVYNNDGTGYRGCIRRLYGENGENGNVVTGFSYYPGELMRDGQMRVADVSSENGSRIATLTDGSRIEAKTIAKLAEKVAAHLDARR